MAEIAVSLVIDQLLPLLKEEAKLLRGIHKEFADIKDELECIQAFLKDADKRASTTEGVKTWLKQVREAAFRIEDIIDEYMIHVGQQPRDHGCVSLLHKLKAMISRRRIASEIQDIKSDVRGIKERSERYGFQPSLEQGPSNSKWHDPRLAALYIEESEFVGFEEPRKRLIDWMVKGRDERTVVSVVGMGGQGKTTLAKKVFDSKDVVRHFDCHVWITVSQSYNVEVLLREMLTKLFKEEGANPPQNISQMDRGSLIDEVRNYLQEKRYVVMFDDVWDVHFWDAIEFPVIDNKNGSRILITTRNLDVVASCKRLLKVLDYESAISLNVPKNLETLIHLKYLNFWRYYRVEEVLESIGMLQHLETLELKGTSRWDLPKEIIKLRKLRHLTSYNLSLIQLKDGIGEMTSLQTLRKVDFGGDAIAIKELGKLKQLRDLGLVNVGTQDGSILSSSISEMRYLEKLFVSSRMFRNGYEVIDLHLISTPTMLRKLTLRGRLQKLPEWILKLQNLVELKLMYSCFTKDPIKSLKSLQNLLLLSICIDSCFELELHFEDGGFQKLKELHVGYVDEMRDTIIDKGALPSLKKLELMALHRLKSIPTGIEHLDKLEVLYISGQGPILRDLSIEDIIWLKQFAPQVEFSSYHPKW